MANVIETKKGYYYVGAEKPDLSSEINPFFVSSLEELKETVNRFVLEKATRMRG